MLSPPIAPPPLLRLAAESRAILEYGLWLASMRQRARLPRGDGHGIIVYPGLLAGDTLTAPLRGGLRRLGYNVSGWEQGVNLGLKHGLLARMRQHLAKRSATSGGPVSLVGWSLGGLYARELAKREPALVRQVITLGTPFVGDLRGNHAWKLYERLNDHSVDAPPLDTVIAEAPPVPCLSIYSLSDGIVACASSLNPDLPHCANAPIGGSHVGLPWNVRALQLIAEQLAR